MILTAFAVSLAASASPPLLPISAAAEPSPRPEFQDCPECPEMIALPAGSFLAGPRPGERWPTTRLGEPKRITFAKPFAIGKYEVTWGEYRAGVAAGGCEMPHEEYFSYKLYEGGRRPLDHPVDMVGFADMQAYAAWLTKRTGRRYRLPSSSEWEYAARAGTDTIYPWGNEPRRNMAIMKGAFDPAKVREMGIHRFSTAVGQLPPNAWGLHDMLGNVGEVVADCNYEKVAQLPADGRPYEVEGCPMRGMPGPVRVWRGGSGDYSLENYPPSNIGGIPPEVYTGSTGFRIAAEM